MNIKTLINYFETFTNNHPILKSFSWGNLSDYGREDYIIQYPAIHFVPQPATLGNTSTDMSFSVLIYDLLNEYVGDPINSNQLDSMALTQEILNDFVNDFINQLTDFGFYLNMPVQFTPFVDKFKESVCGVEATITITMEQTSCVPPFLLSCNQFNLSTNFTGGPFDNPNGTYELLNVGSGGIYIGSSQQVICDDYLGKDYTIWGLNGGTRWIIAYKPNLDPNNYILSPQYQSYPDFTCDLDEPSFFSTGLRVPIQSMPAPNGLYYPQPGTRSWSSFNATITYPTDCFI